MNDDDRVTVLETPDLSPVTSKRAYTITGVHELPEALKRLRANLEQDIARAQAVLALADDQFTISYNDVW